MVSNKYKKEMLSNKNKKNTNLYKNVLAHYWPK